MHLSAQALLARFPGVGSGQGALDSLLSASIQAAAKNDAAWSYRSALLSFVVAINGLDSGYRSWPIVNLYYSAFYSIRSILYSNFICIYYCSGKPMIARARAGEYPIQMTFKGSGNSHYAAHKIFQQEFPNHPLNGQIDFDEAYSWMKSCREIVNYNDPGMNMDDRMNFLRRIEATSVRASLTYYAENLRLNAFLPEEAVLAFPFFALTEALSSLDKADAEFIKPYVAEILARAKDRSGVIATLSTLSL